MEPEGLSPSTKQSATCPYPEPDQSSLRRPPHRSESQCYMIRPSTPGSFKWSPSLRFPHYSPVCTSPLPHTCHMSCPSQPSWLDHPNEIRSTEHKAPCYAVFSTLLLPVLLSTLFSKTFSLHRIWLYAWANLSVYPRQFNSYPNFNTMESNRLQHDQPVVCVFAQQYSFTTFLSLKLSNW
jgi:hypothetical protein